MAGQGDGRSGTDDGDGRSSTDDGDGRSSTDDGPGEAEHDGASEQAERPGGGDRARGGAPDLDLDVAVPRLALVVLAVVVGVVLVYGALTSGAAFGAFNPSWEGTSDLRSTAEEAGSEPVVVQNTTAYDEHGADDVAFVLAPGESYEEAEATRVRGFVERGGTLVVADRGGEPGRGLLEAVGADARPDGTLLRDERSHHRHPALPIADDVADHQLVAGVEEVTLNYGTSVEPGNATVLVRTSGYAYLDADGDGSVSDDEELDSHPVVTVEDVGDGRVVVVGDASVFINAMLDAPGNRAFATALLAGTDHALVDVSHRESVPPLAAALLALRSSVPLQVGFSLWLLATVGLAARAADSWWPPGDRTGADDLDAVGGGPPDA